jgi:hypothetical protein
MVGPKKSVFVTMIRMTCFLLQNARKGVGLVGILPVAGGRSVDGRE